MSTAQIGVGTSADAKIFLHPDLELNKLALVGSPHKIGTANEILTLRSSLEGIPGTM